MIFAYLLNCTRVHTAQSSRRTVAGESWVGSSYLSPFVSLHVLQLRRFLAHQIESRLNRAQNLRRRERQRVSVGGTEQDRGGLRDVGGGVEKSRGQIAGMEA